MNRFTEISDKELIKELQDYAKDRKGEIADLTRAAAIRIAELAAKVSVLEEGDDRK